MSDDTWHIHIEGQVQGVGFRPFVYQKAKEYNLNGWVNNAIDGVHCSFTAKEKKARWFYQSIVNNAPLLSHITAHALYKTESKLFTEFRIIQSNDGGEANLLITPDFAMCAECRDELFTESNRRYGYPFITCTNCGPRYSIIKKLPYDRKTTTMELFGMCGPCQTEYENPQNRRYYSQTNSCGVCGISQSFYDTKQNLLYTENASIINKIVEEWSAGKIIALKGIGGFLLTCDAMNASAIQTLRKRKQRPAKPFALMYPDIATAEQDLILCNNEKKLLSHAVSPIILAELKENFSTGICVDEIAPRLSRLGMMIPYTPLYALLLESFGRPVIATSGNISGSPIVYRNRKALNELTHIADFVLTNNRNITVPQDDSIAAYSKTHHQKIVYRRSRGWAPAYINPKLELPEETILATGAILKSTFTYLHRQNVFVSQYLGNLDHFDTEQNYRHLVRHFFQLFDERPVLILADKHPDYFSTRFAIRLSDKLEIRHKKYQHHEAHFAAVLGENALLNSDEPIMGVIWDGTGLGNDRQIWGGEFFRYEHYRFKRCTHFSYFNFIAGDKMPLEPRISALAATQNVAGVRHLLQEKFSDLEWKNYHTLLQKKDCLKTSSVGRLFDAASSLLGLTDRQGYEGEAAMLLEEQARKYTNQQGLNFSESYFSDSATEKTSTENLMQGIINDLQKGTDKEAIAARFHFSLVKAISAVAEQQNVTKIAFSGGVFQNGLLVDLIIHNLGKEYELYFHRKLSPNDENISFGQLMHYMIPVRSREEINFKV